MQYLRQMPEISTGSRERIGIWVLGWDYRKGKEDIFNGNADQIGRGQ